MADPRTLAAYALHAADFAARFGQDARPDPDLTAFLAALPPASSVLDLGCGPATASAAFRAAGHRPDPVDASPEMVALANARHAIGARIASFDDLDAHHAYDGVWANFSLLHAPRADLPRHLAAIHRALRPGGLFHLAMKTGSGESRDRLDRHYTYVTPDEITALLTATDFALLSSRQGQDHGLAGTLDRYILLLSRA